MTRAEELQAALDYVLSHLSRMETAEIDGMGKDTRTDIFHTLRRTLEQAMAKEAVTVPVFGHLDSIISDINDVKKDYGETIPAKGLELEKIIRWVSENAGKPVNHSPDVGNMVWQPIETAPKDGKRILLSDPYSGVGDGYYCNLRWWFYECGDDWYSEECNPTHWMPLPAAPKAGE